VLGGISNLKLPPPGQDPIFESRLQADLWSEPLFLLIAATAARQLGLATALSKNRTALARFAADHEADRLEKMMPGTIALRHMVALITLAGGAPADRVFAVAKAERERLGWNVSLEDLRNKLRTATPGGTEEFRGIEPDFIGEAFILQY